MADETFVITEALVASTSIQQYDNQIIAAFLKDINDEKLLLSTTDPVKDIFRLVKFRVSGLIGHINEPVTSVEDAEFIDMKAVIISDLEEMIAFKVLLAATDKNTFKTLFPYLKMHYEWFKHAQSQISIRIAQKFPCLIKRLPTRPPLIDILQEIVRCADSSTGRARP